MNDPYAKIRKLLAAVGATLDVQDGGSFASIILDAPAGKLWAATGTHAIVESRGLHGSLVPMREIVKAVQSCIAHGFEDCEDMECDTCHPVETEAAQ